MNKVLIFGNAGSGKSTLANSISVQNHLAHLDLDVLAWEDEMPPRRRSLSDSEDEIRQFIHLNDNWVVEGCYADLLNLLIDEAEEIVFLNPGVALCIENCKNRPWEPHKYDSIEKQNENLAMLVNWVKEYSVREDGSSLTSHRKLFDSFSGVKVEYTSNERFPK